jgi:hypothetical protein
MFIFCHAAEGFKCGPRSYTVENVLGTAVYNAPNAGSFKLQGEWFHFGFDMSSEYEEIELESHEAEMEREWQERKQIFKTSRPSSMAERSPHISVHTQALRGLAAAKI